MRTELGVRRRPPFSHAGGGRVIWSCRAPARHDAGVGVWTNRVEPRGARSHSRVVRAWHVSTSQLTLAVRLNGAAAPLGVAINGPFARWRPSGPSPPWGRRCPIGRMRGQPFLGATLSFLVLFLFSDKPSGSSHGRGPFALPPSSTVTRVLLTALRLVGGGARARRSRGLAADLLHQPTRGQWGRRPRARGHRADHEHGLPNTSRDACSGPSQSDL